jgi:uncharacterized integral membrane protein
MSQSPEQKPAYKLPTGSASGASGAPGVIGKGRSKGLGRNRGKGELARSAALVILAVLITLFAVLNLKEVRVDWIFGSGKAPLIIVIVVSLLVGIVIAYIAERLVRKRH